MSERDERPKSVKDYARVDDAIIIKFSKILDGRYALLVVLEAADLDRERLFVSFPC